MLNAVTVPVVRFPSHDRGGVYIAKLDPGADPLQYQYIRLYYTPNNGNLTTGTVTAFITTHIDKYTSYADNVTIS